MTDDGSVPLVWRMDMLNGLASDDLTRSTQALLSLTYHDPDRFWLEDLLLREVDEANDPALRALAVTCMGHLGRMRGEVSNRIIEFLEGHLGDAVLGGIAEDALGDIRDFAVVVDPPTA